MLRLSLRFVACFVLLVVCAASACAVPMTFPDDGTVQTVNVIRRYDDGAPLFTLGADAQPQVFDGGHSPFQWNGISTSGDGKVLQITLDQV